MPCTYSIIMPHSSKKQRLTFIDANLVVGVTAGDVSVDVLANILGFLDGPNEIMLKRRVCKKWREAVKMTIVPPTYFRVDSVDKYNAISVMTRALPNLQQITLSYIGKRHKYSVGRIQMKVLLDMLDGHHTISK